MKIGVTAAMFRLTLYVTLAATMTRRSQYRFNRRYFDLAVGRIRLYRLLGSSIPVVQYRTSITSKMLDGPLSTVETRCSTDRAVEVANRAKIDQATGRETSNGSDGALAKLQ